MRLNNENNRPKVCEGLKMGAELSVVTCFNCRQQMVIEYTPGQKKREFKCCECEASFSIKITKKGAVNLRRLG